MERFLNPLLVQEKLREKKLISFTLIEFRRLFGISEIAAKKFTERYVKKGFFIRLKKGLFTIKANPPSPYVIANRLYEPSYISFDAALSFHGIIPETIYVMTSATPKATRRFQAVQNIFMYHKIKRNAYTGYKLVEYLGEHILIAEPEKALADYLYFVDLEKRQLAYERIDLKKIKRAKLIFYARLFGRPKMIKIIERLYADFRKHQRIY